VVGVGAGNLQRGSGRDGRFQLAKSGITLLSPPKNLAATDVIGERGGDDAEVSYVASKEFSETLKLLN
jgi:hypothetical protein